MSFNKSISDEQWQATHVIAHKLVRAKIKDYHLKLIVEYVRHTLQYENSHFSFFKYLQHLAQHGEKMTHGKQKNEGFQIIYEVCEKELIHYKDSPTAILEILGWAFRMMKYYKNAMPAGESNARHTQSPTQSPTQSLTQSPTLKRQPETPKIVENFNLKVGQRLPAIVVEIKEKNKGKKITYEIQKPQQKLSNEEYSHKSTLLSEGQSVTVEIVKLKDDGSIKKIKLV
ncbi:MAG: hypothetical protein ACRCU2_14720 [Planktothrix sp.]